MVGRAAGAVAAAAGMSHGMTGNANAVALDCASAACVRATWLHCAPAARVRAALLKPSSVCVTCLPVRVFKGMHPVPCPYVWRDVIQELAHSSNNHTRDHAAACVNMPACHMPDAPLQPCSPPPPRPRNQRPASPTRHSLVSLGRGAPSQVAFHCRS